MSWCRDVESRYRLKTSTSGSSGTTTPPYAISGLLPNFRLRRGRPDPRPYHGFSSPGSRLTSSSYFRYAGKGLLSFTRSGRVYCDPTPSGGASKHHGSSVRVQDRLLPHQRATAGGPQRCAFVPSVPTNSTASSRPPAPPTTVEKSSST